MKIRWIQVCFLLTALPQFTEAAKVKPLTAKCGEDVTLPCENSRKPQDYCGYTTWIFHPSEDVSVELISEGNIKDVGAKKNRLRVTENCSLVINNVQKEDAGRYDCIQYLSDTVCLPESLFRLRVSAGENTEKTTPAKTSAKPRATTASSPVTTRYNTTSKSDTTSNAKRDASNAKARPLDVVMLTLRVFEVLLLTVITVLLFRAQVKQGSSAGNTECDGDDCTVNYENDGESSASVRFHRSSS